RAAGHVVLLGEAPEIDLRLELRLRRKRLAPEAQALGLSRHRKLHDRVEASQERVVDVRFEIRGENDHPFELLDALQKKAYLLVGEAIVRVIDARALSEERVRLVEEENPTFVLGHVEDAREVLLRLADVLRDD